MHTIDGSRSIISIHAPSRERHNNYWFAGNLAEFQSTLPRGSDHSGAAEGSATIFQSTLPRGSDWPLVSTWPTKFIFQSTLPRGSDSLFHRHNGYTLISIHAPSRERLCDGTNGTPDLNFNPRSLAGATRGDKDDQFTRADFNPRSLAGATPNKVC